MNLNVIFYTVQPISQLISSPSKLLRILLNFQIYTPSSHPLLHCALKVNATFPVEAPPTHVLLKLHVGHNALAALTQPSQRPLLTLIVAAASVAFSSKKRGSA
jgi:hypothetical protein